MHVAAIGIEVDDRIADELTGTVIGDVAAASGFVHLDAARGERVGGGEDVRASAVAAHAERHHLRMFEQQQRVGNAAGAAFFDQRALQRERVRVRHAPETPNVEQRAGPTRPTCRILPC